MKDWRERLHEGAVSLEHKMGFTPGGGAAPGSAGAPGGAGQATQERVPPAAVGGGAPGAGAPGSRLA